MRRRRRENEIAFLRKWDPALGNVASPLAVGIPISGGTAPIFTAGVCDVVLNRRWVRMDGAPSSIHATRKRAQTNSTPIVVTATTAARQAFTSAPR